MKLSVLVDNMAGGKFGAEHGLSYLIEHPGFQLLFDTGHSDLFLRNAQLLGIDLDKVDTVVLSHGHWDHGNGLQFLDNKKLICHPDVFTKRYNLAGKRYIGLNQNRQELAQKFDLQRASSEVQISEDIYFLGEIPRVLDFEAGTTPYFDEQGKPDLLKDDSALAIKVGDGLVIVTGCSHSGICNIVHHAQKVTGIEKVKAVIGGFHLKKEDIRLQKTIEFLKALQIGSLYPSHCTELPALATFYQFFSISQVKSGMQLLFT